MQKIYPLFFLLVILALLQQCTPDKQVSPILSVTLDSTQLKADGKDATLLHITFDSNSDPYTMVATATLGNFIDDKSGNLSKSVEFSSNPDEEVVMIFKSERIIGKGKITVQYKDYPEIKKEVLFDLIDTIGSYNTIDLTPSPDTLQADNKSISRVTLELGSSLKNEKVNFSINQYGSFVTSGGVLTKTTQVTTDFNGDAIVQVQAGTIAGTATVDVMVVERPEIKKTCYITISSPGNPALKLAPVSTSIEGNGKSSTPVKFTSSASYAAKDVTVTTTKGSFINATGANQGKSIVAKTDINGGFTVLLQSESSAGTAYLNASFNDQPSLSKDTTVQFTQEPVPTLTLAPAKTSLSADGQDNTLVTFASSSNYAGKDVTITTTKGSFVNGTGVNSGQSITGKTDVAGNFSVLLLADNTAGTAYLNASFNDQPSLSKSTTIQFTPVVVVPPAVNISLSNPIIDSTHQTIIITLTTATAKLFYASVEFATTNGNFLSATGVQSKTFNTTFSGSGVAKAVLTATPADKANGAAFIRISSMQNYYTDDIQVPVFP